MQAIVLVHHNEVLHELIPETTSSEEPLKINIE